MKKPTFYFRLIMTLSEQMFEYCKKTGFILQKLNKYHFRRVKRFFQHYQNISLGKKIMTIIFMKAI